MFVGAARVLHLIQPSRDKAAPQEMVCEARPGVWVLNTFGAQRGYAERWQMCLTHLLCDTQFAIDCGDAILTVPLKRLLLSAIATERRKAGLKGSALAPYRYDLDRHLDRILAAHPTNRNGKKLRRQLRPSVIFRKCRWRSEPA